MSHHVEKGLRIHNGSPVCADSLCWKEMHLLQVDVQFRVVSYEQVFGSAEDSPPV